MAQSAKSICPLDPNSQLGTIIIKALDTTPIPGAVLTIWNAGRNTSPVAVTAPATIPSTSLFFTIKVPYHIGFFTNSLAFSIVIPLFLRTSYNKVAYSSAFGDNSGSIISTPESSNSFDAFLRLSTFPNNTTLAIFSFVMISAALTTLSSLPSGRTIVLGDVVARSLIFLIKSIFITPSFMLHKIF